MELRVEKLSGNVARVVLTGRLDAQGAAAIDRRLSEIAGSGRPVILDLAAVSFLSSMGIRSLVVSARASKLKGGKLVLLSPVDYVASVLKTSAIDRVIPTFDDLEQAVAAVTAE